jgi:malate dehydrogenase (oxaloacetate-decarboxylating)(NADP+)
MITKEEVLNYHSKGRKGKIEVLSTKPFDTARDLSLAYTPGVAIPCLEIEKNPEDAYKYTAKGNLVAVISNGTAVLGLGNIGALAGKPVMEGKGVLFKKFADIDVFDLEIDPTDVDKFCEVVEALEPTFGAINLEDIKAPECFLIEERLKRTMNIPVMHDDQHGTAIISGAALLNALEILKKDIKKIKLFVSGAGAAACACTKMYIQLGVNPQNIIMSDINGILRKDRSDLSIVNEQFATDKDIHTLEEGIKGADVYLGLSAAGVLKPEMLKTMAKNPIVFALANPNPEITYPDAKEARNDVIIATGRSDYPNQVNNVLGFPFIFRGALDVRATSITEGMKIAAVKAIANLAKEDVPDDVIEAYGGKHFKFGRDYIIPKPFDRRVLLWVAPAIAKAAMDEGIATLNIDLEKYKEELEGKISPEKSIMRLMMNKAKNNLKKIVFPEGRNLKILRAVQQIVEEGIAIPILLGNKEKINKLAEENDVKLDGVEIIDYLVCDKYEDYAYKLYELRQRKGYTEEEAFHILRNPNYFAMMMLKNKDVDGVITGESVRYSVAVKPALEIIKMKTGINQVSGMHMVVLKDKIKFFTDTTVNIKPDPEDLANIAILTADTVKHSFGITPRVAMLSFSNFGSMRAGSMNRAKTAAQTVKETRPDIMIDGEMQVNVALSTELLQNHYKFSTLKEEANILVFPNLSSGNIAYKMMATIGQAQVVGPILLGMSQPVNILEQNSSVEAILNLTAITAVQAQGKILN